MTNSYQNSPGGYPSQQGYPQQPQQGYPSQQGYPQQGYPQQVPQQGYQPPQQQGYPPPQQPMPSGPPTSYSVSDEDELARYQEHSEQANQGFGPKPTYVKWLGPNGSTDWRGAHPGFESKLRMLLCSPWAQGKSVSVKHASHFISTNKRPQGTSITCAIHNCPICSAVEAASNSPDTSAQGTAKRSRVRYQWLYNVLLLDFPQAHYGDDGMMRPMILGAGSTVHKAIGEFAGARGGLSAFANFQTGRPLVITKRKTGPEVMNVEYSVIDEDPQGLPQPFWPAAQNLWDLEELTKAPPHEELMKILQQSKLAPFAGGSPAYNPNPVPPGGNPYGAPQGGYPAPPVPQQQMPTPVPPMESMPQPVAPPPPPMSPPAVSSTPSGPTPVPPYSPQPSQGVAPPQQAQPQQQPQQQQGGEATVKPPFDGAPSSGMPEGANTEKSPELQELERQLAGM